MQAKKRSILMFAMLVFLVGCGVKLEAAAQSAQPTAIPKEAANPTRFALLMAQKRKARHPNAD